jgi:uncharacterized protein YkwD
MFKKTWKQIKIFIVLIIILICLPHSIMPLQKSDFSKEDLENYLYLNGKEQRLIEYKDDDAALKLKLTQLEVINKSRKKFRAQEVKLDILASRVANKMCREAAENNFVGHWNMAGEKPYHRYAFAGGYDHVSENAFGEWSTAKYDVSGEIISSMMKSGHESFMSERAPNDGHKKTIIDKSHNFVGIGFYLSGKQFRYYEEFIDRYLMFENIPSEVNTGEPTSITIKTNGSDFPYFLIIYHEKYPQPISPAQLSRKGSYADFSDEEYQKIFAWDLSRYREGDTYRIPLSFSKQGLYYIHIYTDKKELTKPSTINTKNKTPQSGIVIKVKQAN